MSSDHPIYDGPLDRDVPKPTFVEINGRRFEIELEWKEIKHYYDGDCGWVAKTEVNGHTYSGRMGSRMVSVVDLATQLNRDLDLRSNVMTTELPMNVRDIQLWLHNTSR